MEDDEDLELLRLAALKSLKKEVPPTKPANNIVVNHVIPVVSNVRPVVDKFYAHGEPEMVQPNLIHHPVPPYINTGFEKMEINESYMPQRQTIAPVVPFNEFGPYGAQASTGVMDPTSNVQLSPRTAAFVFENKQIIKRRQGLSPSHSPGRWSRSPSPENWKYRRSKSRSPAYPNNSPHFRNRSVSRSPQRRRHTPQPAHSRRNRTRSPAARTNFDGNVHRLERRSPVPNRRANSPNNRPAPRQWRGHSPPQRDNGVHVRKSGSPRGDEINNRRRHTRSPNAKSDIRKRSTSRSPNRKFPRNNVNRGPRRSPHLLKRFNNSNKPGLGGPRNRNHNRRSGSPNVHRRSHSPHNHHKRRSPMRNNTENGDSINKKNEKLSNLEQNENSIQEMTKEQNEINENEKRDKIEQDIEDELLASSDSENSDSDNNDGIDLFASEESESENEGRFKLNSSKGERKVNVPTVSFSDLGKTTAAPTDALMRDLDELQTETHNSQRKGGSRRDNDRNRNRRDDRRPYNRDRERDNRERDRNRDRDRVREKERESSKSKSSGSWKNAKNEDSRKKEESNNDVKGEKKQNAFKSTFTSVDNESRTKTPDGGKFL